MNEIAMTQQEREEYKELVKRVDTMESQLLMIQMKIDRILSIVKGIAIGIAAGGVIFGFVSIKDLISIAK